MSIEKTAGIFTVHASEPSPRWVTIKQNDHGRESEIRGFEIEDLRDLRYAIDRVLAIVEGERR